MRRMVVAAVLMSTACASGAGTGGPGVNALLRLAGSQEADPPRDGSEYFVVDTVPGEAQRAFNAVRYTYEGLGIPFTYYDDERYQLGGFIQELRELDHEPPSTWVDCGHDVVAGNNADRYAISVAIGSRVVAVDATTSTIETVIRVRSKQRDVSSSMTRCATLGTLEKRIAIGALRLLTR